MPPKKKPKTAIEQLGGPPGVPKMPKVNINTGIGKVKKDLKQARQEGKAAAKGQLRSISDRLQKQAGKQDTKLGRETDRVLAGMKRLNTESRLFSQRRMAGVRATQAGIPGATGRAVDAGIVSNRVRDTRAQGEYANRVTRSGLQAGQAQAGAVGRASDMAGGIDRGGAKSSLSILDVLSAERKSDDVRFTAELEQQERMQEMTMAHDIRMSKMNFNNSAYLQKLGTALEKDYQQWQFDNGYLMTPADQMAQQFKYDKKLKMLDFRAMDKETDPKTKTTIDRALDTAESTVASVNELMSNPKFEQGMQAAADKGEFITQFMANNKIYTPPEDMQGVSAAVIDYMATSNGEVPDYEFVRGAIVNQVDTDGSISKFIQAHPNRMDRLQDEYRALASAVDGDEVYKALTNQGTPAGVPYAQGVVETPTLQEQGYGQYGAPGTIGHEGTGAAPQAQAARSSESGGGISGAAVGGLVGAGVLTGAAVKARRDAQALLVGGDAVTGARKIRTARTGLANMASSASKGKAFRAILSPYAGEASTVADQIARANPELYGPEIPTELNRAGERTAGEALRRGLSGVDDIDEALRSVPRPALPEYKPGTPLAKSGAIHRLRPIAGGSTKVAKLMDVGEAEEFLPKGLLSADDRASLGWDLSPEQLAKEKSLHGKSVDDILHRNTDLDYVDDLYRAVDESRLVQVGDGVAVVDDAADAEGLLAKGGRLVRSSKALQAIARNPAVKFLGTVARVVGPAGDVAAVAGGYDLPWFESAARRAGSPTDIPGIDDIVNAGLDSRRTAEQGQEDVYHTAAQAILKTGQEMTDPKQYLEYVRKLSIDNDGYGFNDDEKWELFQYGVKALRSFYESQRGQ